VSLLRSGWIVILTIEISSELNSDIEFELNPLIVDELENEYEYA